MSKVYFPSKNELEDAIIQSIKNLGGVADVQSINQEVINILKLPEEVVMLEDDSGLGTKLDYRLRWCRTELKSKHIIKNVKRGTWTLESE